MRGLRLFVRPIEPEDREPVQRFLESHASDGRGASPELPACGLLGKLLGEVVAVACFGSERDALTLDGIVVAQELRKKRIGRAMLREVVEMASRLDLRNIVAAPAPGADEFYRRVGFVLEGNRWVLAVPEVSKRT